MALVAERDDQALAELYDRHGSLVYKLARAIVGADVDAEEVTSDVFVQLWEQGERFDARRGALRSWLATITRSRAVDRVRSAKRRHQAHVRSAERHEAGAAVDVGSVEATDRRAHVSKIRETLDHALDSLTPEQRRAIEMAYFGGLSQSEIAGRLGDPLGTVKTRIRDGMGKLRALVGSPGVEL